MNDHTLHVRIVTLSQILFEGDAQSVSSVNSQGRFDILREHANFITIVENKPITIRVPNQPDLTYKFPLAIIFTTNNMVNIYTYPQAHK